MNRLLVIVAIVALAGVVPGTVVANDHNDNDDDSDGLPNGTTEYLNGDRPPLLTYTGDIEDRGGHAGGTRNRNRSTVQMNFTINTTHYSIGMESFRVSHIYKDPIEQDEDVENQRKQEYDIRKRTITSSYEPGEVPWLWEASATTYLPEGENWLRIKAVSENGTTEHMIKVTVDDDDPPNATYTRREAHHPGMHRVSIHAEDDVGLDYIRTVDGGPGKIKLATESWMPVPTDTVSYTIWANHETPEMYVYDDTGKQSIVIPEEEVSTPTQTPTQNETATTTGTPTETLSDFQTPSAPVPTDTPTPTPTETPSPTPTDTPTPTPMPEGGPDYATLGIAVVLLIASGGVILVLTK